MEFWKYQGTGNDFVVLNALEGRPEWLTGQKVRAVCDRHFGVGADGILLVERGRLAPWFMRVLNADGSEAEMCGNGIRCVARYLVERLGVDASDIPIETLAGIKPCLVTRDAGGNFSSVSVGLGGPILDPAGIPVAAEGATLDLRVMALDREFAGTAVGMGNPHFVIFTDVDEADAARFGSVLTSNPLFPRQANIEFAHEMGDHHFRVIVFERGVGLTLACGTGAGATGVAAVLTGRASIGRTIRIDLPGGPLGITVTEGMTDVILEGDATPVFSGDLDPAAL
jgi:diaminopimelate epimerase